MSELAGIVALCLLACCVMGFIVGPVLLGVGYSYVGVRNRRADAIRAFNQVAGPWASTIRPALADITDVEIEIGVGFGAVTPNLTSGYYTSSLTESWSYDTYDFNPDDMADEHDREPGAMVNYLPYYWRESSFPSYSYPSSDVSVPSKGDKGGIVSFRLKVFTTYNLTQPWISNILPACCLFEKMTCWDCDFRESEVEGLECDDRCNREGYYIVRTRVGCLMVDFQKILFLMNPSEPNPAILPVLEECASGHAFEGFRTENETTWDSSGLSGGSSSFSVVVRDVNDPYFSLPTTFGKQVTAKAMNYVYAGWPLASFGICICGILGFVLLGIVTYVCCGLTDGCKKCKECLKMKPRKQRSYTPSSSSTSSSSSNRNRNLSTEVELESSEDVDSVTKSKTEQAPKSDFPQESHPAPWEQDTKEEEKK